MTERRCRELAIFRERNPGLNTMQAMTAFARLGRRTFRMHDPRAGGHPVHRARLDALHGTEAVAVDHAAFEEVRHGRQPDVRVRPHVRALARSERDRTEVIEENERADHLGGERRQQPLHGKATEVAPTWFESQHDKAPPPTV